MAAAAAAAIHFYFPYFSCSVTMPFIFRAKLIPVRYWEKETKTKAGDENALIILVNTWLGGIFVLLRSIAAVQVY